MTESVWDKAVARKLLAEHLGVDMAPLNDRAALLLCQTIAPENRRKLGSNQFDWQGLAFALLPNAYGKCSW
jgi:hypothetical protein